jgi:hypothetical protein
MLLYKKLGLTMIHIVLVEATLLNQQEIVLMTPKSEAKL